MTFAKTFAVAFIPLLAPAVGTAGLTNTIIWSGPIATSYDGTPLGVAVTVVYSFDPSAWTESYGNSHLSVWLNSSGTATEIVNGVTNVFTGLEADMGLGFAEYPSGIELDALSLTYGPYSDGAYIRATNGTFNVTSTGIITSPNWWSCSIQDSTVYWVGGAIFFL
jgi:hypothetical protein